VVKKHDFRTIQRKNPQKNDFPLNFNLNIFPQGETAGDLAKKFAQNILRKSVFATKKHDFRQNPSGSL
jgi:hypothetical protein